MASWRLTDLRPGFVLSSGIVFGAVAGGVLGYRLGQRSNRAWYEKRAVEEIEKLSAHYEARLAADHEELKTYFDARVRAMEAQMKQPIAEVAEYLGYMKRPNTDAEGNEIVEPEAPPTIPPPSIEDTVRENVFESNPAVNDDWDYGIENAWRHENPGKPFVIHLDEYGEGGFDPAFYTFYDDDKVLADEHDEMVDDVESLVGYENLEKFGHGSDNANVVMIRNVHLNLDIEVTRSHGSYGENVAGFLKHNHNDEPIPRRRRGFDDD